MNNVERKFYKKAVKRGGLLLFEKGIALDFIDVCQKQNIAILGIDGFYLAERETQPSMINSIDFEKTLPLENRFQKAKDFINSRGSNLHWEIICDT